MIKAVTKKPRLFYGYWIAIAAAAMTTIQSGCGIFAFSLFVKPLEMEMGWSRGEIMLAFTIYYLLMGISATCCGRMIDRYDVRKIMCTGVIIAGLSFVLLNRMSSIWQFYLGYGILGVGMAGIGYVPASAVISRWFNRRRGTALGIMSVGLGAGGIVMGPLTGSYLIPEFGWSVTYLFLAAIACAVVIPLALLVVKNSPSDKGLYPDGVDATIAAPATGASPALADSKVSLRMAFGIPAFWLILVSFMASNFSQGGIVQTQVPYLEDTGFPVEVAAGVLGVLGLTSGAGKVIFGWLCDRILPKYACIIGLFLQLGSMIVLFNIRAGSPVSMVWLYAVLFGFGVGSWLPTMSMLTSTTFGMASYGSIFGVIAFAQSLGVAFGPLMSGYIFDANNSYYWAFVVFIALYAVAIPCLLVLRSPKRLKVCLSQRNGLLSVDKGSTRE